MRDGSWTDVAWVDLLGRLHVIRVLSDALRETSLTVDVREALGGFGGEVPDVEGELVVVPDLSTLRALPWDVEGSLVLADLHAAPEQPSPVCSRSALKQVLRELEADGYAASAAAEFEFFLVDPETRGPVYAGVENYSLGRVEYEPVLAAIRNQLSAVDIPIEASNPEYSGGQFEVNIAHGEALEAADRAVLLRHCVRSLARDCGFDATFMAKPWSDQAGCGMHVHQSLWRNDTNEFFDEHELSAAGRAYVAGLLERICEFALLGSPTPNAYHRRAGLSFAPTVVCWGGDNRGVAVRAVVGEHVSTRVEQRDASADCNVYLAFAGQFAAGLDGIRRGLEPPPRAVGNAYELDLPRLPRTFLEAYELLDAGEAARRLLGGEIVDLYLRTLAPEIEVFLTSASDWERSRYAEVLLR
jgi:glutamine synthetase